MKKLIVTLDRGNSSAKLALWDEAGTIVRHLRSADCSCARACADLVRRAAEDGELVGAAFASVVKDGGDEAVERALREAVVAGAPVVRLEAASRMPMSIAYSTPGTLGADRIAAALGAMALAGEGRPLLVIDLGTAITYDIVDASGTFRGGNIAPGLSTRFKSLHDAAPALPLVAPEGEAKPFGDSTAEAIRSGVVRGVGAEINGFEALATKVFGGERSLTILTGGDACYIADTLGGELPGGFIVNHDLIHLGLKRFLDYNYNENS